MSFWSEDVFAFSKRPRESRLQIPVRSHYEHWPVATKPFKAYAYEYLDSPTPQQLETLVQQADLYASFRGVQVPVFTRIGEFENRIYLDLCNESWQVAEISSEGWRVISNPPVRFRRVPGMLPLPKPSVNGSLRGLRALTNLHDDENWILAISWVLGTLHPKGPYPLLCLQGEKGSGKTSTARMLRKLIDPSDPPLGPPPRNEHELMINALHAHIQGFDNLGPIKPAFSDQLARLSRGTGSSRASCTRTQSKFAFPHADLSS
jgi:hypothetical protein